MQNGPSLRDNFLLFLKWQQHTAKHYLAKWSFFMGVGILLENNHDITGGSNSDWGDGMSPSIVILLQITMAWINV